MFSSNKRFLILCLFLMGVVSCAFGMDGEGSPFDYGDADGDSDGDSDRDGDIGGDGDGDSDGDSDGDGGPEMASEPWVGVCLDGVEQDEDSLIDCESFDCIGRSTCCREAPRAWIQGQFTQCTSLAACGWSRFPENIPAQDLDPPWISLSATEMGETGVYTDAVAELTGEPVATFTAFLGEEGCTEAGCSQFVGIAFTAQDHLSSSTGVVPTVGIVLDGDSSAIHFLVSGRVEHSVEVGRVTLTTPLGYAIQVRNNGSVAFWEGLETDLTDDGDPTVQLVEQPSFESSQGLLIGSRRLRLAVFGSFRDQGTGVVGGLSLEQPICDVPDGFDRSSDSPVLSPTGGVDHLGRPSIVRRSNDEGLLMVHESDNELTVSTSVNGSTWRYQADILRGLGETEYGRVARRAPSLVHLGPDAWSPGYHLWFEAESEFAGITAEDEPRFAIIHVTSENGFDWYEEPDLSSIALIGSFDHPWREEVGQPTVVMTESGQLMMLFVGTNPQTGATAFGRATSDDGKRWLVDDDPIQFENDQPLPFERDGISSPTIIRRGQVIHLWYTGANGARSSIGYAIGMIEYGLQWSWQRFGPVLEPEEIWETQRVTGPAIVTLPSTPDLPAGTIDVGIMHLWYEGGIQGHGRIGLATRELPAQQLLDETLEE